MDKAEETYFTGKGQGTHRCPKNKCEALMQLPNCYDKDGHPIRCSICGAPYEMLDCIVTDIMEHIVMEQEWRCTVCESVVAYWAHGYFNPCFKYGEWVG